MRERLRRVNWHKLITVTMPPGRGWPKRQNLSYQSAHLRSLWRALERRFGKFRYVWVREIGAPRADCCCHPTIRDDGSPALDCICGAGGSRLHLHILIDVQKFIPGAWLKRHAAACGFGFVDIREIRGSLVEYVTKYLSKGWAAPFPPRARRIQTRDVPKLEAAEGWKFSWFPIHICVPWRFDGLYCEPGVDFWNDSG